MGKNAKDVVTATLGSREEREARLKALRDALVEGEQNGPAEPFDFEVFIASKRRRGRK